MKPINIARTVYHRSVKRWPRWMGNIIVKYPSDMMIYQQIIYETKPDIIIECGTSLGGSALFFANLFDIMGTDGRIVSIDIKNKEREKVLPQHPRIKYLNGSTLDSDIFAVAIQESLEKKCMVTLDSCHESDHVLAEANMYHDLVTLGQYLVIEDTTFGGRTPGEDMGDAGPRMACHLFLARHESEYEVIRWERQYILSCNIGGWLRKK